MSEIIKISQGPKEDGSIHMSFINGKWRCAEWERQKATEDDKRIAKKIEGEERL